MFRKFLTTTAILALASAATVAHAAQWFSVTGDPQDPSVDTAELDVSTVGSKADVRQFLFRVTLARPRYDASGLLYQSYLSNITIECRSSSIFHDDQVRYRDPGWNGPTQQEVFVQPKPMAFGGLIPDPRERLLAAACGSRTR